MSKGKMSSGSTNRSTWALFVFSLLATAVCRHGANATVLNSNFTIHPSLRQQCPNLTSFQRSSTCPGLLGIFPDNNTAIQHFNLPWSCPPKCLSIRSSSASSSLSTSSSSSSSSPASFSPSYPSYAASDISATMSSASSSLFLGCSLTHAGKCSTAENVFCLFSFQNFRNGQGLSLIVSPTTAANLLGIGALDDDPAPWASHVRKQRETPYQITDVKGKGKGVVATRSIKQGEILMVDVPALLISEEFLRETEREGKGHLRRRMVKRGLEQLPESTRRKVLELQKGSGSYEIDAILGINLKGLGGDRSETDSALALLEEQELQEHGEGMMGLFAEVARINHSCRPNARLRFSKNRLAMEVVSYRPIFPGEEILISYTPLNLPPSDRHNFLQQTHHFTCHCPLCTALSDDPSANTPAAESHSRRQHLNELWTTMLHAKSEGFYQDAINILKDWLDFAEVEGLLPLMGEYHGVMAESYLMLAERGSPGGKEVDRDLALRGALREARMAVDAWVRLGSVDGGKTEDARAFLEKVFKLKERRKGR
ncbi:SET domain-containing protein [Neurospora crassa]|uniref:SET domain-containing protein n=1 Tax=Neurospora crassa (strain ATCC 24698 / 74-OR23-1A / CBS 708.71 / DSM 1257 / FGSC 987) TaxID=367110 RepID=Q7S096_NEUCR|nr:hypothetical protein NCU10039 [Neurospora crassa OR74A]EAA28732.2 hypothetical protein NCU10039 [Neurospora crassa OR74A]KHE79058.1 SET domain-containing protein [Neurospora crassa]|eukprot:XP_957968.2 hypothetical protein NCU10039 [Neurospora crassa OR74A]